MIAGCSNDHGIPDNELLWSQKRPPNYKYTLRWFCACDRFPASITVRNGNVASVFNNEKGALAGTRDAFHPAIEGLFQIIKTELPKTTTFEVAWDGFFGFPKNAAWDYSASTADDIAFEVMDLTPIP